MTNTLSKIITEELVGFRLDAASAKIFSEYSRSFLTQQIQSGILKVNNATVKPTYKVKLNDLIILDLSNFKTYDPWHHAEDLPLDILYQDNDLIILNKPAGLITHPGAGVRAGTLLNSLLFHFKELASLPRAGLVHRLDKDTTGCLLVARNIVSHTALVRALQAREIKREYLALVHGKIIGGKTIVTNIARHPRFRTKMAVTDSGRHAVTHFQVMERFEDFSLLKVSLETGRTHQIRVHLSHERMPIVGDPLYGKAQHAKSKWSKELSETYNDFKRQALHATSLMFTHPATGQNIYVEAPLPHDLNKLLNAIRNYEYN